MRKLIVAIALMLGVYFVIGKIAELQAIVDTLKRGDLRFIFLALLVELIWLVNQAASYRSIYRLLRIPEDIRNLIIMAAAANFVKRGGSQRGSWRDCGFRIPGAPQWVFLSSGYGCWRLIRVI